MEREPDDPGRESGETWAQPVMRSGSAMAIAREIFIRANITGAEGRSKSKWRLKYPKVASPGAERARGAQASGLIAFNPPEGG
jgi:hypothetical protein